MQGGGSPAGPEAEALVSSETVLRRRASRTVCLRLKVYGVTGMYQQTADDDSLAVKAKDEVSSRSIDVDGDCLKCRCRMKEWIGRLGRQDLVKSSSN